MSISGQKKDSVQGVYDMIVSNGGEMYLADIYRGIERSGVDGMIIPPCSMKTLSAVVNSYADSLIVRAADVCLKERKPLVLMPRETPLHTGHCKLLYEASQLGAIIAPPLPAFYIKPDSLDDVINHSVGRVLDLFGLDTGFLKRWQGAGGGEVSEE